MEFAERESIINLAFYNVLCYDLCSHLNDDKHKPDHSRFWDE